MRSAGAIGLAIRAAAAADRLFDQFNQYFGMWREADSGGNIVFELIFPRGSACPRPTSPRSTSSASTSPSTTSATSAISSAPALTTAASPSAKSPTGSRFSSPSTPPSGLATTLPPNQSAPSPSPMADRPRRIHLRRRWQPQSQNLHRPLRQHPRILHRPTKQNLTPPWPRILGPSVRAPLGRLTRDFGFWT